MNITSAYLGFTTDSFVVLGQVFPLQGFQCSVEPENIVFVCSLSSSGGSSSGQNLRVMELFLSGELQYELFLD